MFKLTDELREKFGDAPENAVRMGLMTRHVNPETGEEWFALTRMGSVVKAARRRRRKKGRRPL